MPVQNSAFSASKEEIKKVSSTPPGSNSSPTPTPSPVLKTENSNFEAKGGITSISGDNFDVEGITIIKNPQYLTTVSGNIELGKICEVKGVLENGVRYAKEIKIEEIVSSPSPPGTAKPTSQVTPNNFKPPISPTATVLSRTKSNPETVIPSANPSSKPSSQTGALIQPKSSSTLEVIPEAEPKTTSEQPSKVAVNFFFEPIKPVLDFFKKLFKGWF